MMIEALSIEQQRQRVLDVRGRLGLDRARPAPLVRARPVASLPVPMPLSPIARQRASSADAIPAERDDERVEVKRERTREHALKVIDSHNGGPSWFARDLLVIVAAVAGHSAGELRSHARSMLFVRPRQTFFWIGKRFSKLSYPQLADICGGRDHTTALYNRNVVQALVDITGPSRRDDPVSWSEHILSFDWDRVRQAGDYALPRPKLVSPLDPSMVISAFRDGASSADIAAWLTSTGRVTDEAEVAQILARRG